MGNVPVPMLDVIPSLYMGGAEQNVQGMCSSLLGSRSEPPVPVPMRKELNQKGV